MEAHSGVSWFWDSLLRHTHTNRKAKLGITHPQKRNFACCFDLESILANFIKSDQALSQDHSLWEHREPMTCWSAPRTLERFAEILSKCRDQNYIPRIVENSCRNLPTNLVWSRTWGYTRSCCGQLRWWCDVDRVAIRRADRVAVCALHWKGPMG